MISEPKNKDITLRIPPNYSSWQTTELSYQCCKDVIARNVPGVFVECGVGAGNNFAAMCAAGRHGWGFDSFEGIPWAGPKDDQQPGLSHKDPRNHGVLESSGVTVHSMENVMSDLAVWGIENYTLIKGWFQHTVRFHRGLVISVLRLDGDLYESTMVCLEAFYPQLSKGGYLIIDDWGLAGCRRAFEDYFENRERPELVLELGPTYWMK